MMRKPFTLVEVLIAMAVLSVFMFGLLQFYASSETALSSGIERTEMFERARIAMDMMANDITCVYYSQTDSTLTPFRRDGDGFMVSTIRPEKLVESSKTNIIGVRYRLSSHKLLYAHDTKGDTFSVTDASWGDETELVDGVYSFSVSQINGEHNGTSFTRLPSFVVLRLRLVDKKTAKRMENNSSFKVEDDKIREFRRMVVIDRGQPKPKSQSTP